MTELSADAAGIAAFGSTAAQMATALAAAGAGTAAAGPALLGPVFGVIGTDFVAAFAAAHVGHVDSIATLTEVYASMGVAAASSAAEYTGTDAAHAAALNVTEAGV